MLQLHQSVSEPGLITPLKECLYSIYHVFVSIKMLTYAVHVSVWGTKRSLMGPNLVNREGEEGSSIHSRLQSSLKPVLCNPGELSKHAIQSSPFLHKSRGMPWVRNAKVLASWSLVIEQHLVSDTKSWPICCIKMAVVCIHFHGEAGNFWTPPVLFTLGCHRARN